MEEDKMKEAFIRLSMEKEIDALKSEISTKPEWELRYLKMEEKRNALRQGMNILKSQVERLQLENDNLKKAYDEERARANVLEEDQKEASIRLSMEREIGALKSDAVSKNEDLFRLVQTFVSGRDVEIKQLLTERRKEELQEANKMVFEST